MRMATLIRKKMLNRLRRPLGQKSQLWMIVPSWLLGANVRDGLFCVPFFVQGF